MSIWLNENEQYEPPKTGEELKLEIQNLKIEYIALDEITTDAEIEDPENPKRIELIRLRRAIDEKMELLKSNENDRVV